MQYLIYICEISLGNYVMKASLTSSSVKLRDRKLWVVGTLDMSSVSTLRGCQPQCGGRESE